MIDASLSDDQGAYWREATRVGVLGDASDGAGGGTVRLTIPVADDRPQTAEMRKARGAGRIMHKP